MNEFEKEIHYQAMEATARQTFKALRSQDRPDIAVAIILKVLDDWYKKGIQHGKRIQGDINGS